MTVEIEERANNDDDIDIDMEKGERSVDMPLKIDSFYNMVTCEECGIGLPFEWILNHLKDNHGIKLQ
jgi:hypothetical protein